jgi:hypothetical protein
LLAEQMGPERGQLARSAWGHIVRADGNVLPDRPKTNTSGNRHFSRTTTGGPRPGASLSLSPGVLPRCSVALVSSFILLHMAHGKKEGS